MGGKSQDFGSIAAADGAENDRVVRDQIYANRPDQTTPRGGTSWGAEEFIDPATGESTTKWSQNQFLTPELQRILNKQTALQEGKTDIAGGMYGRMADEFGQGINWDGLSPMAETPQVQQTLGEGPIADPYQTRQAAENSVYSQAMSRLNPQFEGERSALEIKMRNQGLAPGDEAWNSQMNNLGNKQSDQQNQALWSANQAGREESGQMFGQQLSRNQNAFNQALGANNQNFNQGMQSANYANQLRQQELTETMQKRGFSLNEINALLSGQQVNAPTMPNFSQAQVSQGAPIYQAGVDQSNFNQGQTQQGIDAITGMAGFM